MVPNIMKWKLLIEKWNEIIYFSEDKKHTIHWIISYKNFLHFSNTFIAIILRKATSGNWQNKTIIL